MEEFGNYGKLSVSELIDSWCIFTDIFFPNFFNGALQAAEEVLRPIMNKPDLKVSRVTTQEQLRNPFGHSIILDILAESEGDLVNIELQRSDIGADIERALYHSALMLANTVKNAKNLKKRPEIWVIFITEHDIFKKGWRLYDIGNCFTETGERINDRVHILYVNGSIQDETPVGKVIHDLFCTKADEMYNFQLSERMKYFKETKEGSFDMESAIELLTNRGIEIGRLEGINIGKLEGINIGKTEGINIGKTETMKSTAKRMIEAGGFTDEMISRISGLSIEEVRELEQKSR